MCDISSKRMSGFTLVELMIVVAIAAVVMAITIPVSRGMSESQDRSQCVFNMRTIGQALLAARNDYQGFPRDRFEAADASQGPGIASIPAVNTRGTSDPADDTVYSGVQGLFSLYYLTEYVGEYVDGKIKNGPGSEDWFKGGNYLRYLTTLHCPAVDMQPPSAINPPLLLDNGKAYCNYDLYYCRDWFDVGTYPYPNPLADKRNLVESAYPPADTLITFCPYHRKSTNYNLARQGDQDVVLFADGAVILLPAYPYSLSTVTTNPENPAEYFSRVRVARNEEQ